MVLVCFLYGCKPGGVLKELDEVDDLLRCDLPDSALSRLAEIHIDSNQVEVVAYYYLLKAQAMYMNYITIGSDSLLDVSYDYYRLSGDKSKYARTLLYRGNIRYDLGKVKEAMEDYKMAEKVVREVPDSRLQHNIYFQIANIECDNSEYLLALEDYKKALVFADKAHRDDYKAYDFQNISGCFYRLAQYDSSYYYINKSLQLIDSIPDNPIVNKTRVLVSLGVVYYMRNDFQKSKEVIERAIAMTPLGSAYAVLARIHLCERDTIKAKNILVEGLKFCESKRVEIDLLKTLSKVEQQQGNYRRAAELAQQSYQLSDSLNKRQREDNIRAQQIAFDRQTEAERAAVVRRWLWMVIGLAVLIGGVAVVILMRRSQRTKRLLDEEQRRTETLNQENRKVSRELNKTMGKVEQMKRARQEQERLSLNQQREWQRHEQAIERGHRLFMELTGGGNIKQWGREDFKDFRTYYDTVDSAFAETMARQYGQLSSNLYLLAVLEHIGKSDDDIMAAMALSLGALRTTRSRLNQKQQDV